METVRRLLTMEEAAAAFRLAPDSLRTSRAHGRLPGALGFKLGKRIFFDADDIESYIEAQKAEQRAEAAWRRARLEELGP
jgi:hypothetical protein